jgi:fructose-1,6-bisphosphatase/inositol monophosphatase family enzyme
MVDRFFEVSRVAARQIGSVAVRLQGQVKNEGKGGATPESSALSAVDLAAQDIFLELLHAVLPEVAVDGEEATPTVSLFPSSAETVVVLDPIDGTLSYLSGSRDYAVMAGLIVGDRFEAASIFYPAWDLLLEAERGAGARLERGRSGLVPVRLQTAPTKRALVGARFPEGAQEALRRLGVTPEVCRCSAVEGAAPVLGRADGAVTSKRVDRRHAVALFASLEAGASVRFGEHAWAGEDPAVVPLEGPTAVAFDDATASTWIDAIAPLAT